MNRLEQLQSLLKDTPDDPFLYFAIAKEYEKMTQLDTAQDYYQRLIAKDPDYVGVYYHLGKLHEQEGRFEQAIEVYETGMDVARKAGDQHALGELAGAKLGIED